MFEFTELIEQKKRVDANALATARSHVNEIHFARSLNGGKHVSKELKAKHDAAASLLSPEEVKHQQKRAEVMADAYRKHATKVHGYKGNIKEVRSLTEPLQLAKDNGVKRALVPIENKRQFLEVSGDIMEHVDPVFYGDPKAAAFKALGMN